MTDKICLDSIMLFAFHGSNPEEQERGQIFKIDLEVETNLLTPGKSDRLEDTINYSHLYRVIQEIVQGPPKNLIESVAEEIVQQILHRFPADSVRVRITKTSPPIKGALLAGAAVEVRRSRQIDP